MSVNWRWDEKCGEITFTQRGKEHTLSLYQGNALLIYLYEYKNEEGKEMYDFHGFWNDKTHMQKCLGIKAGGNGKKENLYNDDSYRFTKLRLNKAKNRYWKDIVTAFAQAFDDITIELYSEKEEK